MKKVIALILAAALALSMTACGGAASSSAKTSAAASGSTASSSQAKKTSYPTQDIQWIVPYGAGGSSDQMARCVANYAKKYLGVNIIIQNVNGGAGAVGMSQFLTTAGIEKGYYMTSFNTTANITPILGTSDYDWLEQLTPLCLCVSIPIAIVVPKNSPYNSVQDLVEYAKANPGKLQYANAGTGSITDITTRQFLMEAGIKMTSVPFGGGADALTAIMGSQIDLDVSALSEVLAYIQSGDLKCLALCTDAKVPGLEKVPTLVSLGYKVDEKVTQGLAVAKKIDPNALSVLDKGMGEIIKDADFQKELKTYGMDVDYMNSADFASFLQKQRATFTEVVKSSGILDDLAAEKNKKKG